MLIIHSQRQEDPMASRSLDEQIAAAERRVQQLKERKEAAAARALQRMLRGKRSDDTRRKILIGAVILSNVERGEWEHEKLRKMMDAGLVRDDDRALFDLPPKGSAKGQGAD
jgi:hypothetical protein